MAKALLTKAKDKNLKPACMGSLLGVLIDNKIEGARSFAESLIILLSHCSGKERSRAIFAASVLITRAEDAGWSVVWPAIQQDTEFGREVITVVAHDGDLHNIGKRFTEDKLSDLYIWLVRQYPHDEDPKHEEGYWVGPKESVVKFRDSILSHLKQRGTHKACEAIRRISNELPELDWLKWTLFEAQNITRHYTWIPPRTADILRITSNQQDRLVQNGDQLLDVLIESLKRLEAKLQGETPTAQFLWDKVKKNMYKPKDENSFSDFVAVHLDEDLRQKGIIVNREVRIHRGERTDIHVNAVVLIPQEGGYDSVSVIIEVKGCWNLDHDHAMKTQLVDRYLRDNRCQHGLYLVGWFNCEQWDDKDYRKKQTPKLDLGKAQKQCDSQATELSQHGLKVKAFVINTALR